MAGTTRREQWHPPPYDAATIRAVQALYRGKASPADQVRAFEWIVNVAASTYDEPFRPAQSDVRDYMLGRRSVGLAIIKLLHLKPELFK